MWVDYAAGSTLDACTLLLVGWTRYMACLLYLRQTPPEMPCACSCKGSPPQANRPATQSGCTTYMKLVPSPVNEKKPSEHSSPARKELKGNVPTIIM